MSMDRAQQRNNARTAGIDDPGYSEPSFVEALAHPNEVFAEPRQVVEHPWFSDQEKRTILLSWVRDELVKEQIAAEALAELGPHSRFDAVIEALSRFDPLAAGEYLSDVASVRATGADARGRREAH
jgi:hypothetical protein